MQSMGREAELVTKKQTIYFLKRPKTERKKKEVKPEQKSN